MWESAYYSVQVKSVIWQHSETRIEGAINEPRITFPYKLQSSVEKIDANLKDK